MKKILKSNVLWFLLGAILFSGITYVAATSIGASTVEYLVAGHQDIETLEDALDDLYSNFMEYPYSTIQILEAV